jgi:CDP-diacylglycerol--glycerol-3-phosphate 3-phosphatidyltransferase
MDIQELFSKRGLPNQLTTLRILLTPIIIIFLVLPSYGFKVASLVLFILASITDKIDGTLARKYNIVTKFGEFIDPLADKILFNSLLITLGALNILKWWMVVLMVAREIFVQILRIIARLNKLRVQAVGGKIKGPVQIGTIIMGMYFLIINFQSGKSYPEPWMIDVTSTVMIFALFVAYSALLEFLIRNWGLYKDMIKKAL